MYAHASDKQPWLKTERIKTKYLPKYDRLITAIDELVGPEGYFDISVSHNTFVIRTTKELARKDVFDRYYRIEEAGDSTAADSSDR